MVERTEEDALKRVLLITLGGEPVRLRTLDLEESDAWLGRLAEEVDAFDIPVDGEDTAGIFRRVLTQSSAVVLKLIVEYDLDEVLGGEAGIRARKPTKRELRAAIEQMVSAEDPFGEDAVRSVAAAFGEPSRSLWAMVGTFAAAAASVPGLSIVGQPPDTASATASSDTAGAASNSSSAGPTPITKTMRKRKSA